MKSRSQGRPTGEKQPERLMLRGRVRRDRLGTGLLAVSATGIALNDMVFPRLARTGGILQQVSTGILFVRAIVFTATGVPRRQRLLVRLLTLMELITDGVATAAGFAAWIWPGYSRRSDAGRVASLSRIISTVAFALHTVRVAIYLTPSRGIRKDVSAID